MVSGSSLRGIAVLAVAISVLAVGVYWIARAPMSEAQASGGDPAADAGPPVLPNAPYTLRQSFQDEFDALSLWDGAAGTWVTEFGYGGIANRTLTSNGELQIYTDANFAGTGAIPLGLDPFELRDGVLDIVATRVSNAQAQRMWDYRYASGLLTTRLSFSQTYGYFEVRALLPEGKGLWPAFWLLPVGGGWPPEIDVLEQLGRDPSTVYVGYHANVDDEHVGETNPVEMEETTRNFHRYGVLWDREHLVWYVDGVEVMRAETPPDMHQPMYMLVNLAIGGEWAGKPDALTRFPARMSVDYVRAYALEPR